MTQTALMRKLRLDEGQTALIVNPPKGYLELLGDVAKKIDAKPGKSKVYDFAQLFVANKAQYDVLNGGVLSSLADDAMLWICYPKVARGVKTELNRESLVRFPQTLGFKEVSHISIDDKWDAMRFRRTVHVGKVRQNF